LSSIAVEVDSKFNYLQDQSTDVKESFLTTFRPFLAKILNLIAEYLPLEDEIIEILDFIELKDSFKDLKFCDNFKTISEEKTKTQARIDPIKGLLTIKIRFL